MKILQVISSLGNGGAEKFTVELSNELSLEHSVTLISFKKIENWMNFPTLLNNSIKVISLNKVKGFDFRLLFNLYKTIKNEQPKIVHFHLDATIKYILPLVILFTKIKFIHTIHSDLNSEKKRIFDRLNQLRFLINKTELICISKTIFNDFKSNYKYLKFHLVENGISKLTESNSFSSTKATIALLKKNESTKVFVSIGRIDENKNQYLQIKAFEGIESENCILLIIGDDPTRDKTILNKLMDKKTENVFFLGAKENISDYLLLSDALIITSLNEGLPIVALEALSVGKPIITTKAGGMVDIVNPNENGFVCEKNTVEELTKQIKSFTMLTNSQIEAIMQNNINKFNLNYKIKHCAENYLNIYSS